MSPSSVNGEFNSLDRILATSTTTSHQKSIKTTLKSLYLSHTSTLSALAFYLQIINTL